MTKLVFLLFPFLYFPSFPSSADSRIVRGALYSGLEYIESKDQLRNRNDDLLLVGGLTMDLGNKSNLGFELGISDTENNNGVGLKGNLLYIYRFSNYGSFRPLISAGLFTVLYENEICQHKLESLGDGVFQQIYECNSDQSSAAGVMASIGSELAFDKSGVYVIKISGSIDNDKTNLVSFSFGKHF